MSPSRTTPNIMLFSDPKTGEQHGYYDGYAADGVYEYTGEGKVGHQQMTVGNKALLNHAQDGRAVRLFTGSGGVVTYEGEFRLDANEPFRQDLVHSTGGGPLRNVFKFRLHPVSEGASAAPVPDGVVDPASTDRQSDPSPVSAVPIAKQNVEEWIVTPAQYVKASAVEAQLVRSFKAYLERKGDVVRRHRYGTGSQPLFNDVFNETRRQLIEAKGSCSRPAVRMAIGQLLDYQFLERTPVALGVLLPEQPAAPILALLHHLSIVAIWPSAKDFADSANGRFV